MDFTAPSFSLGFDSDDDDPAPPAGSDRREQLRVCAAPDAPSFSLGIDLDDDGAEEEPELPARGRREERARVAAAPDPPSFSLGIDDDAEEEPELPARGRREELARVAAAPDPPSFSLGIDDDDDGDILAGGQCHEQVRPQVAAGAPSSAGIEEEDDDFVFAGGKRPVRVGRGTLDSDPPRPPRQPETNRLKRLRKGPAPAHSTPTPQVRRCEAPDAPSFSLGISDDDDDSDILAGGQCHEQARPQVAAGAPSSTGIEEDAGGKRPVRVGRGKLDSDPLPPPPETNRLKRLRKGPAPAHPTPTPVRRCEAPDVPSFSLGISDDDDFLSGDHRHKQPTAPAAPRAPPSLSLEGEDDDFFIAGDRMPEPAWRETSTLKRLRKSPARPHLAPAPPPLKVPGPPAVDVSPVISENVALGAVGSLDDEIEDWTTDEDRPVRGKVPSTFSILHSSLLSVLAIILHLARSDPIYFGQLFLLYVIEIFRIGFIRVGNFFFVAKFWTCFDYLVQNIIGLSCLLADVPQSVGSCGTSSNFKFSLLNRGVHMTQSAAKAKTSKFTLASNSSASIPLEESCTKKLLPKMTISPVRKIHLLDSDTDADDEQNQDKAKKPVSPVKKTSTAVQKSNAMLNDSWATPALDEFCNEYFRSTKDAGFSQQKEGNKFSSPKDSQSRHFQEQSSSRGAVDDILDSHPPATHYFFHHDPRVRGLVRDRLQHFFPIGAGSTRENVSCRTHSRSCKVANDDWVIPNRRISVPTERRVHASRTSSGSGHWFTDDVGRKVYVSKNGQELTGQIAYRQYQKESGKRFNKYRKKGSSGTKRGAAKVKAEPAAKQGTSRAKRKR
ncbi:hypothetical protein U9M48_033886 [Paspalum notatum var. saurae]|uniref:Uncharacterized protein n=1 Tax=Paspalum notatum var. saurae TaxID=547442 RepID=A0AAQ3U8H2_PASNO